MSCAHWRRNIPTTKPSRVLSSSDLRGGSFANAQQIADQIHALVAKHKPRVVTLDLSRVFDIEYSAFQMLVRGEQSLAEQGVAVWLAGLNPDVLEYVRSSEFADKLGRDRLLFNTRTAIEQYLARTKTDLDDYS